MLIFYHLQSEEEAVVEDVKEDEKEDDDDDDDEDDDDDDKEDGAQGFSLLFLFSPLTCFLINFVFLFFPLVGLCS